MQEKSYEILGSDESILVLKRDMLRLKGSNTFVLITGENGTGKELVARGLNIQENDSTRPFVAVNCAAIPSTLFESEFFGHMKGSFTGATENKHGQFKMADGGDIFLDEVGEIPLPMQAKLLRVLQEKTFTPVGGTKPITVNVRVIAATNRNLEEEVAKGNFREDLYYRLTKVFLKTPPLRERKSDIVPLAEEFLKRLLPTARISGPAQKALMEHVWRGNIRELQNTMERSSFHVKESGRPVVKPEHLGLSSSIVHSSQSLPDFLLPKNEGEISFENRQRALDWVERIYLKRALKVAKENQKLLSLLGMSRSHYYERKKALLADESAEGIES